MNDETDLFLMKSFVGKKIVKIGRMLYVYKGEADFIASNLQFEFSDSNIILLRPFKDGETLRVESTAWIDPLGGILDKESEEFVERCGKWSFFDVTQEAQFNKFIGKDIEAMFLLKDSLSKTRGICIEVDGNCLIYYIDGDNGILYTSSAR